MIYAQVLKSMNKLKAAFEKQLVALNSQLAEVDDKLSKRFAEVDNKPAQTSRPLHFKRNPIFPKNRISWVRLGTQFEKSDFSKKSDFLGTFWVVWKLERSCTSRGFIISELILYYIQSL
jgi:hypothetical protein